MSTFQEEHRLGWSDRKLISLTGTLQKFLIAAGEYVYRRDSDPYSSREELLNIPGQLTLELYDRAVGTEAHVSIFTSKGLQIWEFLVKEEVFIDGKYHHREAETNEQLQPWEKIPWDKIGNVGWEKDAVKLFCEGKSYKEIAQRLTGVAPQADRIMNRISEIRTEYPEAGIPNRRKEGRKMESVTKRDIA